MALPAGLAMAQIGEFSFILASVGVANRVLDEDAYRLALSVIAVSLMISPLWMVTIRRFHVETTKGISTMREALAIAYASELEGMQKGRHGVMFDGGKFSPVMDGPTHIFHQWVARKMQLQE